LFLATKRALFMDLSILIPTKNRPDFILRVLKYYSCAGFSGDILIGDSSDEDVYRELLDNISFYSDVLRIRHFHKKNLTADKMVSFLCDYVDTQYSVMHPDDDVVLVPSISECLEFLDQNADYSAVHGLALNISIDHNSSSPFGGLTSVKDYPLAPALSDYSYERVMTYFANVKNINMSVVRHDVNSQAFSQIEKLSDFDSSYVYGELVHAAVVLARGKVGSIDVCYLVRQKHYSQFYRNIQFKDWLSKSNICGAELVLRDSMINALYESGVSCNQEMLGEIDQFLADLRARIIDNVFGVSIPFYVRHMKSIKRILFLFVSRSSSYVRRHYSSIRKHRSSGVLSSYGANKSSCVESVGQYFTVIDQVE